MSRQLSTSPFTDHRKELKNNLSSKICKMYESLPYKFLVLRKMMIDICMVKGVKWAFKTALSGPLCVFVVLLKICQPLSYNR